MRTHTHSCTSPSTRSLKTPTHLSPTPYNYCPPLGQQVPEELVSELHRHFYQSFRDLFLKHRHLHPQLKDAKVTLLYS